MAQSAQNPPDQERRGQINALSLCRRFLAQTVRAGDICIDATAGRGKDTACLCELVGETGKIYAFDIQQSALESTAKLLADSGFSHRAQLIHDSHAHLARYFQPESIDCIVFNLGWLPGGDHSVHTRADTSLAAVSQGLEILRPFGAMSICVYYGRDNGYEERDALLDWARALDPSAYTAIVCNFLNRKGDMPFPIFIIKQG